MAHVLLIILPMLISFMSHVDFKKWPCCPVELRSHGPYHEPTMTGPSLKFKILTSDLAVGEGIAFLNPELIIIQIKVPTVEGLSPATFLTPAPAQVPTADRDSSRRPYLGMGPALLRYIEQLVGLLSQSPGTGLVWRVSPGQLTQTPITGLVYRAIELLGELLTPSTCLVCTANPEQLIQSPSIRLVCIMTL